MNKLKKQLEILSDKRANGKERPWKEHKVRNELLALAYEDINARTSERLRGCATRLSFAVQPNGKKTLAGADFCRVKLCPMCQWRKSLKVGSQMRMIMQDIAKGHPAYRYVFVTFTIANCTGNELNDTITLLFKAFNELTRTVRYKKSVKGYYRALEVTHNVDHKSKDYDTFHPHIHALFCVPSTYFTGVSYITQLEWTQMWQHATKIDYVPVLDVRAVKGNTPAAIAECAKYGVKSDDYIVPDDWDLTVDTVRILDKALFNRRLISYGGLLKSVHKKLHLDKPEEGDLVHIENNSEAVKGLPNVYFAWKSGYKQYQKD